MAIKTTCFDVVFDGNVIKNKAGTMHFGSRDHATDAINKLGLDAKYCEIIETQARWVNERIYDQKRTVKTGGNPKRSNHGRIEDACKVKNEQKGKKKWDTMYSIVGLTNDDEQLPKVVHVLCNNKANAMEVAEYRYDILPMAAMEGRLNGRVKQFVRDLLTAAYADEAETEDA